MAALPPERGAGAPSRGPGICVWLTGLSGAGKSTTAVGLGRALRAVHPLVAVLDGDRLRATISRDLGFSKADRDTSVMRAAALAHLVVERGGVAICALVSPYRDGRARARQLVGMNRFIEVFVDASLDECKRRDPKGLYLRARAGHSHLTGVDDPYELPLSPDITLTTVDCSVEDNIARLLDLVRRRLGTSSRESTSQTVHCHVGNPCAQPLTALD